MPLTEYNSIDGLVDNFTSTLDRPITLACKWYSYYYLAEVHNIQKADFELTKLANDLHNTLLDYSVYATYRELTNKAAQFEFVGTPLLEINKFQDVNGDYPKSFRQDLLGHGVIQSKDLQRELVTEEIRKEFIESYSDNEENIPPRQIYNFVLQSNLEHPMGSQYTDIHSASKSWERNHGVFSNPRDALKVAKVVFNTTPGTKQAIRKNSGWVSGFGGPAWASVCKSALEYYKLSKVAYVDLMFSIEHNNGNYLNKISPKAGEEAEDIHPIIENRHPEIDRELIYPSAGFPNKYSNNDIYQVIMPEILDMVKNEEMATPLKIASKSDPRIRRWSQKAGVL